MTRHLATFLAGAIAGALLALLLTSPTQSRQASTPRPAAVTPLAPVGTPAADRGADSTRVWAVGRTQPSATIGKQPAPTEAPATAKPSPGKTPRPTMRPAQPRSGVASWVAASYGAGYLAARLPRGTRLRVCGPVGCVTRTVNDYGPSRRVHPDRIVDLSRSDFTRVCGDPSMGVCRVGVERLR